MATIAPTHAQPSGQTQMVTWAALTNTTTDVGNAVELPYAKKLTVQIIGTFGTGGNLRFQGSNDGTNWAALNDVTGTALNFTVAGIEAAVELPRYLRPAITAGDGTTSLTCILCASY
jgi:hypothetical protein